MPTARYKIVHVEQGGVYHCISRCVRRCFLCGTDPLTGNSFEHRRAWIETRLKVLAELFEFSVYSYAVMSNHLHIVVRTNPQKAQNWNSAKIVKKAYALCPGAVSRRLGAGETLDLLVKRAQQDQKFVELWRSRLMDLSWFMRFLNEHVARRANREESIRGRFWEGRFRCTLLADRGAILSCMAYVDLNPVRAGVGETPEDCPFTSIFQRIEARKSRQRLEILRGEDSANSFGERLQLIRSSRSDGWLCPVDQIFGSIPNENQGLSEDHYLKLVDAVGRALLPGKNGSIPAEFAPILERLELDPMHWPQTVNHFGNIYWRVAGRAERLFLIARRFGQKWFRRSPESKTVYLTG